MSLSIKDLRPVFKPAYLQRGEDYYARGMVKKINHPSDDLVTATVRGSGRKNYYCQIHIDMETDHPLDIEGHCSCPVGYNCKHVAAALIQFMNQHRLPQQDDLFGMPSTEWVEQHKIRQAGRPVRKYGDELLLYLLAINYLDSGNSVTVITAKTRRLADGSYADFTPYTVNPNYRAGLLRDEDVYAVRLLKSLPGSSKSEMPLKDKAGAKALNVLIKTGRCHWLDQSTAALRQANSKTSSLSWQIRPDASQLIVASKLDDRYILLPVNPPHYLNTTTGDCGVLNCEIDPDIASMLVASAPVSAYQVQEVREALIENLEGHAFPLPVELEVRTVDNCQPVPCLQLLNEQLDSTFYQGESVSKCIGMIHFEYDGFPIHPYDEQLLFTRQDSDGFVRLQRDPDFEQEVLDRLYRIGLIADDFSFAEDALRLEAADGNNTWLDFMLNQREQLEAEGWQICIDEGFACQFDKISNWYADVDQQSNDWFKLELGVDIDGKQTNLLPFLVDYLSRFKGASAMQDLKALPDDYPLVLTQENNRLLHIPLSKVRHIIDTLIELYDPEVLDQQGRLELSRYHSSQLSVLEKGEGDLSWRGGLELRQFGKRLQDFDGIKTVTPPTTLKAELRDYQKEGLNWLQFLREYQLGGILADDMGLGKTIQALAHLLFEKKAGRAELPSLVIAPTSLMLNWRREAAQFAPSLKVLVLQGSERKMHFDKINRHDIVLSTYPLLSRDAEILLQQQWHMVILDEAQHIKNAKSKAAQTARQLNTHHRLCLTGTPMENHLGELWSQFHFLMPGMLGDEKRFRKLFRNPIEKQHDDERQQQLRRRIAPFMLRRDKSEVATELAPLTQIVSEVDLDGAQRDLYETIRVSMHNRVKKAIDSNGIARSQIVILDALLKLRQICCHPQLLKLPSARKVKHSAKLNQLMEMLPEMVEEGRRILLFSQFTSMLAIIEEQLQAHHIAYVKLTGQTRNREKPIDAFQTGQVPVFLISLKAGGVGLNLTAADTVIHYDPWWNPAAERQATDRAYRIGQDKPVFVYKMISAGTVEEKIAEMQQKKQELANALFADSAKTSALSHEDLQGLFDPLG